MSRHRSSHATKMRASLRRVWSELDYISQRMLDVRIDEQVIADGRKKDSRARATRRAPTPAH
jgi:hypothetical protein